jgi:hypothetical protein
LTNQQVELLSKVAFLERNGQKVSQAKLHKCIPILVNLYKIIVRYQKRINEDFKPVKPIETIHMKSIDTKDYCPMKIENGIKVVKIEDKYKFQQFDVQKMKEIIELEKEISEESTEYESVYEKEIKEKAQKYDEMIARREERDKARREQIKRKIKAAKNVEERKKLIKENFLIAKNEVKKYIIDGFEYSINTQYAEKGLAGYLAVVTNDEYINAPEKNLETKRVMKERMAVLENKMDEEDQQLLKKFRNKIKDKEVVELVESVLEIRKINDENRRTMKIKADEEKKKKMEGRERFFMLGNQILNEYDLDKIDEKAKEKMIPYLKLIVGNTIKKLKQQYQ